MYMRSYSVSYNESMSDGSTEEAELSLFYIEKLKNANAVDEYLHNRRIQYYDN